MQPMDPQEGDQLRDRLARAEQRLRDLGKQVDTLMPLATTSAAQAVMLSNIESDIRDINDAIKTINNAFEQRSRDDSAESRSARNARWAAIAVVLAAALTAGANLIAILLQSGGST